MTLKTHTTALMSACRLPEPASDAPEWVHILPKGTVGTGDERGPYHYDPQKVIAASFATAERLPIDENHSTDLAAPRGEPAPAHGWIVEMEERDDGIWGKVEWTKTGHHLVAGRAYRGLSPVILHDSNKVIHSILRASLVNKPNLRGLTALHQQQENQMDWMKFLASLLGLGEDATEDQIKAAAKAKLSAKPDGKGGKDDKKSKAMQSQLTEIGVALGLDEGADVADIVAAAKSVTGKPAEIKALQSEIGTLTKQLNAIIDRTARDKAAAFVDAAISEGRVGVKPLRDHYISMHMEDAERVEKEIGAMPVLNGSSGMVVPPKPKDGKIALNAEQVKIAAQLGIDPDDYAKTLAEELATEEAM
ncbi:phage protease [Profundibacter sp.]